MSTTSKVSRGKPVTLAKSASGAPEPVSAVKPADAPKPANISKSASPKAAKSASAKPRLIEPHPDTSGAQKPDRASNASTTFALTSAGGIESFEVLPAKWNELMKAQTDAAMAWWQDAKDAKTLADALAINARHSRVQFELAAGQAREMAVLVQKSFEQNAERLRTLFGPQAH